MEKFCAGVYRIRLGQPEKFTPSYFREYPMQEQGNDVPIPFCESEIQWKVTARGMEVSIPLDGQVFGFGLQLKGFNHTNQRRIIRNNADAPSSNGESHAPVPFYVSTAGYGIFVDSARDVTFHCGKALMKGESAKEELPSSRMLIEIPMAKGVDLYVFAGRNVMEAVQKYNMFSGGGANPPEWGLGPWYRMYQAATAQQWIEMAERFQDADMPVSVMGLEPGCYTHAYSCSFAFNDEKLGDCKGAIKKIQEMGYKVNLWQHCYTHPSSSIYNELFPYSGSHEVWGGIVPDLALDEARKIFGNHMKTLGVDCFKLDECDGSDHTGSWSFPESANFPSGMDGDQMRHMLGFLYQQTINHAFPNSSHSVRASGALAAPYPFVLYSDLYEHKDFIRGVVNAGFTGLLWSPEVRHAESCKDLIRRLQTALFSPQLLVNAWYLPNPPWMQIDRALNAEGFEMEQSAEITELIRDIFKERMKLIPYLKKQFEIYEREGIPVFRALVMDYPEDPET